MFFITIKKVLLKKQKKTYCYECSLVVPRKLRHGITAGPSNLTPRAVPEWIENGCPDTNLDMSVRRIIIHRSQKWKQAKCPPDDEQINQTWSLYTVGYWPRKRMKWRHVLHRWVKLESITLSEGSGHKRQRITGFRFYEMSRISTSKETGSRFLIARGWGGG